MLLRLLRQPRVRKVSRRRSSFRPILMGLEDRVVPSQVNWIGGDGDFTTAANWQDLVDNSHHVPRPGDYAAIGNPNVTVTISASYTLDHLFMNGRLVLNSGVTLTLTNPIDGSSINSLLLNSGATVQTTGGTTTISGDSSLSGTFNTAAGASLGFIAGMQTVHAGAAFNGAGAYYVSNGTFNITGSTQIAPTNFTLYNGTLGGTGTFEVPAGATFTWSAGAQVGPGTTQIDKDGTMTLISGNKKPLDGRVVVNSGTALIGPADTYGMDTGNNAIWTNTSGALFNIQTGVNIYHEFGNSPGLTINNAGTFRKTGGTTTLVSGVVLNNTGTIDLQNGTLELGGGGVSSGPLSLGSSATLAISNNNATYTLAPGAAVNGTGRVHVTGGHLNVTGTVSVANTTLDGGSVDGTGTYTAATTFAWNNGGMAGSGTTIVPAGATMTIDSAADKYLDGHTLENDGTTLWTGTGVFRMYDAAIINNTATFTAQTAQATLQMFNQNGLPSTFNNSGTVAKAGDVLAVNISIAFNNSGAVAVHNGSLNFAGGTATDGSSYSVDAGTALNLVANNNILTVSGTVTGTGTGIVTLSAGTVVIPAAGAVFQFDPGVLQWTGGTIFTSNGGTLTNTGDMTISGANDKFLDTNTPQSDQILTLDNEGTMLWNGTGLIRTFDGVIINNGTSFDIKTGDQGDGLRMLNQSGLPSIFINAGSLTKSAGLAYGHIGIDLENQGSVTLSSGGLDLYGGGHSTGNMDVAAGSTLIFTGNGLTYYLDAGASITGAGSTQVAINPNQLEIRAAVTISTNLAVYRGNLQIDDTGSLTVGTSDTPANYTQTDTLTILFSSSGYGQLNVTGTAQLGGALNLGMLNGYRPPVPSSFVVLTYASHTQTFASINGTDVGGGVHLNPTYNTTNLTLTASQTGPSSGNRGFSVVRSGSEMIAGDGVVGAVPNLGLNVPMMHDSSGGWTVGRAVDQLPLSFPEQYPGADAFFEAIAEGTGNDGWISLLG